MFDFTPSELIDVATNLCSVYGSEWSIVVCSDCGRPIKSSDCVLHEPCEEIIQGRQCDGIMVYDFKRTAVCTILCEVISDNERYRSSGMDIDCISILMQNIYNDDIWSGIIYRLRQPHMLLVRAHEYHNESCLRCFRRIYSLTELIKMCITMRHGPLFDHYIMMVSDMTKRLQMIESARSVW